jgi:subtilisin family serine protease
MAKAAGRLLILSLRVVTGTAHATEQQEQQQNDGLRGTSTKHDRNLQFQQNFDPSRVKVLVQYKTPQGKLGAKDKASNVGYESERFSVVAMEVDSRDILALENDPNIESVSLNQENHLILPIELRGRSNDVSPQSNPTISKPTKSKPAKTVRTNKKRRNLAEEIPWGINAIQANGVQPGSDAGDIVVCVVDTGYDTTHTDLPGRDSVNGTDNELYNDSDDFHGYEWHVDEDWHGTHVSHWNDCRQGRKQRRCGWSRVQCQSERHEISFW